SAPQIALGGPEDTGQGRLLPTTSVDQFAATLGRWFGVSDSELPLVAPNIANFSTRNLGFV
ncbi:MAG: Tat pathway signal protein, partial [Proteobacteria bacterium]|nr:Tat pathway signal protein [Pseudomonadota bacterium]